MRATLNYSVHQQWGPIPRQLVALFGYLLWLLGIAHTRRTDYSAVTQDDSLRRRLHDAGALAGSLPVP